MSCFIHGDNIETKLKKETIKYNIELLKEIKIKYLEWKNANLKITGISKEDIKKKVGIDMVLHHNQNFIQQ